MTDYEERQQVKRERVAGLQALNPHLTPGTGATHAAKNIRIVLKASWPKVKFSVKTDHFANGNSVDVRWEDGPTTKAVDAAIGRFCSGHFDGRDDSYRYSDDPWVDAFGGTKYLHTTRRYSEAGVRKAVDELLAKYGSPYDAIVTYPDAVLVAGYLAGALGDTSPFGNWDGHWRNCWREVIARHLQEMDYA